MGVKVINLHTLTCYSLTGARHPTQRKTRYKTADVAWNKKACVSLQCEPCDGVRRAAFRLFLCKSCAMQDRRRWREGTDESAPPFLFRRRVTGKCGDSMAGPHDLCYFHQEKHPHAVEHSQNAFSKRKVMFKCFSWARTTSPRDCKVDLEKGVDVLVFFFVTNSTWTLLAIVPSSIMYVRLWSCMFYTFILPVSVRGCTARALNLHHSIDCHVCVYGVSTQYAYGMV